ncbi:MAG: histidinol-phosphate transaminase [Syntrophus sp. (in: bacteria)]|nr:histidinol-phosphate transaminase [Syntrophus sp. (in: bacteria)]
MNIEQFIRAEVLAQKAYPAEVMECRIKLDANESPYGLPAPLQERLFARIKDTALNRYPDAGAPMLRKRYGALCGVDENMVMTGNGSDELIQILCAAMARPGAGILIPTPTFVMYRIIALNCGMGVTEVRLDDAFDLDVAVMLDKAADESPALIFLSYPNSPTGNWFGEDRIRAILEASAGVVVVDEAYFNFSGKTFLPLLKQYDNLVILRTLSKVGYAALRIGFLLGAPELVRELNKVRLPYNMNALSQAAAGFFMDEQQAFSELIDKIVEEREILYAALQKIDGVNPYPSAANFIFFSCTLNVTHVYERLIRKGILIKPFIFPWSSRQFIRVTVGKREENEAFIEELKRVVAK